ncbi:Exosome component 5 [Allomyces arbusculus]|nr:Exosome component 5 [Allomyces arbusculus]
MTRANGRSNGTMRPLRSAKGVLNRADGSGRFAHDKTTVLCGVYGPVEVKLRDEQLDRATLEVIFKQNIGLTSTREKYLESFLKETLEALIMTNLHPRTLIQITFQTLQNDGSLLSAAFNAACMALMNAGIPLHSTFASVSLCVLPSGDILLDPTADEEEQAESRHVFVFDSRREGAYCVHSEGPFLQEKFDKCYDYAALSAKVILDYMKAARE